MSAILGPDGTPATRAEQRGGRQAAMVTAYEAANRADFRHGYFYMPALNPSEQLDTMSLQAIRERTDYLYKNVGAVTMLIDRVSLAEAGTGVWPKWVTGQEDFDKAATDAFHFANHDPRVFSADANNDAYSVQYAIRRCIALYGDCFGQLLRPSPGALHPQLHLIPGWRCDSMGDEPAEEGWDQGIRYNARGRAIQYKFISGKGSQRRAMIVEAADVLHFHDPFLPEQRRGVPCLAAVAKKMFRREDIGRAIANGTLARERLGFAIEFPDDGSGGPTGSIGAESDGDTEVVEKTDGTKYTLKKIFGEGSSEDVEIPDLPAGAKISTIESNRPGTAVMEYQDSILREAAWSRKYSPEYVFFMAGVGQGTVARGVMLGAGEVIVSTREFQLRPQFALRYPIFWVWQVILGGYFDRLKIEVPANWWMIKHIMPALPTMDVGREGALHDNRVATGKESIEFYHGAQGEDASDVEDENVAAIKRRFLKLKKLNEELGKDNPNFIPLRYEDVWARSINVPPQQVTVVPDPAQS